MADTLLRTALAAISLPLNLLGLSPLLPQNLLPSLLSLGPVPAHIAFIMDGNRRFARSSSISVSQGHLSGFEALKRVLEACLQLDGLKCVTVYAFAIDNFKRKEEEVEALMEIAKTRLLELVGHGEVIARHSVRIRIIGRRHLLPPDVRAAMERVEQMTEGNTRATLNICMPYSSRDEIAHAVEGAINASDHATDDASKVLTEESIGAQMMLAHSPPLDILVRTSGVNRLSDFMLWQCTADTQLQFIDCYWPNFGLKELVPIILDYQRSKASNRLRKYAGLD